MLKCDGCALSFKSLQAQKKHYDDSHKEKYTLLLSCGGKLEIIRNSEGYFVCPIHKSYGRTSRFVRDHRKCFAQLSANATDSSLNNEETELNVASVSPVLIPEPEKSPSPVMTCGGVDLKASEHRSFISAEMPLSHRNQITDENYMPALESEKGRLMSLLTKHIDKVCAQNVLRALGRLLPLGHHNWGSLSRSTKLKNVPEAKVHALFYDLCRHEYFWEATTSRYLGFFVAPRLSQALDMPSDKHIPDTVKTRDLVAALQSFSNGKNYYGLLVHLRSHVGETTTSDADYYRTPATPFSQIEDLISFSDISMINLPEK